MDCLNGTLLSQLLPPVLIGETLLGVLGNGMALWFFCFYLKPWKSSSVLLFNLALADFLLIVALPFRACYYLYGMNWKFGDTFCKVNLFMLAMNRTGSIMFLMAIAVDRYVRVVHPHHLANSLSVYKAACCAAGLWLAAISMTAHPVATMRSNTSHCESFMVKSEFSFSLKWHRSVFVLSFWLPLTVILYCTVQIVVHLRRRQLARDAKIRKALVFVTVVAVIFIICYLPSDVAQLLIWINVSEGCGRGLLDLTTAFYITITLTYLNSMLNPIIYYLSSPSFEKIYRRTVKRHQVGDAAEAEDKARGTGSESISQI